MKKKTFCIVATCFLLLSGIAKIHAQEQPIKWEGKPILRVFGEYSQGLNSNTSSRFLLNRSYLGYSIKTNTPWGGMVVLDILPINGRYQMVPKYASLNYKEEKFSMEAGLVETGIGLEHEIEWGHRYVGPAFLYLHGFAASADLGVFMEYKPTDIFKLYASITNGEGYCNMAVDSRTQFYAGAHLNTPIGLRLNALAAITPDLKLGDKEDGYVPRMLLGGMVAYNTKPFRIAAEYNVLLHSHFGKDDSAFQGGAIYSTLYLKPQLSVFARWDHVDMNRDNEGKSITKDVIYGGFSYRFNKYFGLFPYFRYLNLAGQTNASINLGVDFVF
ncbi:MAG: hypothetical protein Q3998_01030 [Porphyromonas sp.]|nr:hypothetical protein [Porphyromonas sp.]